MAIPESITIKGNIFKAEDLAVHDTFHVPRNSPIGEAIRAIKRFSNSPFLNESVFRIIAQKRDIEIIRSEPEVPYLASYQWKVTYTDKVYLIKDPNKQEASININTDDDALAPTNPVCSRLRDLCNVQ